MKGFKLFFTFCIFLSAVDSIYGWRSGKPESHFGKACTNGTVTEGSKLVNCDRSTMSMVCSSEGKCICAPSNEFKDTEFDPEVLACLPVPTPEDEFRCQTDSQCRASTYGKFSSCSREKGRCECHDEEFPTEVSNNVCYIQRPEQLSRSMPSCRTNYECTQSQLGNLTRCNMLSLTCECYDTVSNGKNNVGEYKGRCVYKRMLGEFCDNDEQCRAAHGRAQCLQHPTYLPGEKTCQCPGNNVNRCDDHNGGGEAVAIVALSTILLGLVATKVIA